MYRIVNNVKNEERKSMDYTVNIDGKKRTVTVEKDGYKGVARCCPTDQFNLQTGIELALERAKVAKATAESNKKQRSTAIENELEEAYDKGYNHGYNDGYDNGHGSGYEEGYNDAVDNTIDAIREFLNGRR